MQSEYMESRACDSLPGAPEEAAHIYRHGLSVVWWKITARLKDYYYIIIIHSIINLLENHQSHTKIRTEPNERFVLRERKSYAGDTFLALNTQ